ncbi:MAG: carboxypeptidase regulatory-like domain-containing protein [Labilithrix sp.]|nr:carboxypeptidase regulatory-like domain-containing protein [Labilithrix sp.]
MARVGTVLGVSLVLGLVLAVGCGSESGGSEFGGGVGDGTGGGGNGNGGFGPGSSGDPNANTPPCEGLQCKQVACAGGGTTSLSGKVYDPSGTVPLYNAIVYVPNAALTPFVDGVSCDKCGTAPSGKPITTALTNARGEFKLDNVPVGVEIPLVVQIGRWRREVKLPAVPQCVDTAVDAANTRLPRNKAEGSIPKIAIATGGADSLECFFRKLGIDDAEFTNPGGAGRVNLYQGLRTGNDGARIDTSTPNGGALWDNAAELAKYDMVILSCEGAENNGTKSQPARDNLRGYLDAGGRVFASHFHYTWFKNGANPLPLTATWVNNGNDSTANVNVDTSFAKGQAFSEWLQAVGASPGGPGIVPMTELRRNVTTVPGVGMGADVSRRWLYTPNVEDTKFFSFNTPVGTPADQQCGRGVYTDIHVSSGDLSGGTFPANCTTTGLTPQEKALLFLMMDLASCIQDDNKPPQPPPATPTVK